MASDVQQRDLEHTPPRDGLAGPPSARPRWYTHSYNRAEFYRMAAALTWLPRRARLGLARTIGRVGQRLLPAERAVVARNLERHDGGIGVPARRAHR